MEQNKEVSLIVKIGIVMLLLGILLGDINMTMYMFSSGSFIENAAFFLVAHGGIIAWSAYVYNDIKSEK